jgi:hypothetical protein
MADAIDVDMTSARTTTTAAMPLGLQSIQHFMIVYFVSPFIHDSLSCSADKSSLSWAEAGGGRGRWLCRRTIRLTPSAEAY